MEMAECSGTAVSVEARSVLLAGAPTTRIALDEHRLEFSEYSVLA